ncbi:hypothetical protein [Mucilaginibacter phyllosphaerae]|uniref:Uncharacterized protein n=1 Tax=Mucilaginibacter phyllosphaerae TaxID=1812349 RepID=A0A4Y8ABN6_9SPHI|nr:hypothetical protein [Mucilaginibacter phyllosphaerae]MBB3969276.1 hypothetical protein [Mucilaginibacter phyllosphaerae]TEW65925.1 hypothetical protein E2R65_12405 [Mucilaginibacter phyllosphaerae]GGH07375.1 hypothetical protein GCM10007352_12110 [Mucilaginibacter phyllosphaerae]
MNILITAATTAQAHKLKASIADNNSVVLGDFSDFPSFMGIIKLPSPASDTYTHEMLTLCLDNNFDAVYLLNRQEADVLLLSETLFNEYNIRIVNGSDNV